MQKNKQGNKSDDLKRQRDLQIALSIIELKSEASIKDIKDIKVAYRKQIKLHHLDNFIANGYPIEMLKEATECSAKINKAYKLLKIYYKFR